MTYNCQDAFRVFDLQEHGFFGITQFKEGLGDLGIYVTFDEVELIFKRYDRDAFIDQNSGAADCIISACTHSGTSHITTTLPNFNSNFVPT